MKKTIIAGFLGVFAVFAAVHAPSSAKTHVSERVGSTKTTVQTAHTAPALESPVTIELPEQYIVAAAPVHHAPARHVETDQEHVARLMGAKLQCGRAMPTDSDMWIGAAYCTAGGK